MKKSETPIENTSKTTKIQNLDEKGPPGARNFTIWDFIEMWEKMKEAVRYHKAKSEFLDDLYSINGLIVLGELNGKKKTTRERSNIKARHTRSLTS